MYNNYSLKIIFSFFSLMIFLISCEEKKNDAPLTPTPIEKKDTVINGRIKDSIPENSIPHIIKISVLEQQLMDAGLVNIRTLDSTIFVDLRYSTVNNFLDSDVYGALENCYLQKEVADKLVHAQALLKTEKPQFNLLVFDGVRPRSIQRKMWDLLDMPVNEKVKYVSNPNEGSLHNFGAAVDLTIADSSGKELDMGTPYDYFGELAYPVKEKEMLQSGQLTRQQIENRRTLRKVMHKSGFFNIQTEWWHFNSCYRKEAAAKYPLIE